MWKFFKKIFGHNNPVVSLGLPSIISAFIFLGNLGVTVSSGKIDSLEFHQLMTAASGIQMLILAIAICALKEKKKEK